MPLCFLEAPTGINPSAKSRMMEKATVAVDKAYGLDDVRIYLREYPPGNVAQNGRLDAEPPRIVFFVEGPPLGNAKTRTAMVEKINAAIADGYRGLTDTSKIAVLVNEYPIENVGFGGRLQSANPDNAETFKRLAR